MLFITTGIDDYFIASLYREFNRNRSGCAYTGSEAQAMSGQRRLDNKPSPKTDGHALMSGITSLFKEDLSPDQISGRLKANHPDKPEKQASASALYKRLYQETAGGPPLKDHFRQKQAEPRKRSGTKDSRGQITGRVLIDELPKAAEQKSCVGDWGKGTPLKAPVKTPI
jgi:IS30 family transposase